MGQAPTSLAILAGSYLFPRLSAIGFSPLRSPGAAETDEDEVIKAVVAVVDCHDPYHDHTLRPLRCLAQSGIAVIAILMMNALALVDAENGDLTELCLRDQLSSYGYSDTDNTPVLRMGTPEAAKRLRILIRESGMLSSPLIGGVFGQTAPWTPARFLRKLFGSRSESPPRASVSHFKVGDVLQAQGDLAGALRAYRQSLAVRERLAAADPSNAGWQYDLAISIERIGDVLLAQGKIDEAGQAYERKHQIIERLAAADPSKEGRQRDLVDGGTGHPSVVSQSETDPPLRVDPSLISHAFVALSHADASRAAFLKVGWDIDKYNRHCQPRLWSIQFEVRLVAFSVNAMDNGFPDVTSVGPALEKQGLKAPYSLVINNMTISLDGGRTPTKILAGFAYHDPSPKIVLPRSNGCIPA